MGEYNDFFYLFIPFSSTHSQVRPVDGFSLLMAHTMRTHARMCILGFRGHRSPFWGWNFPKTSIFMAWVGVKFIFLIFDIRYLANKKLLKYTFNNTMTHYSILTIKTANINTKNCSLSIVLTATDRKRQKSLKRWYYTASRWHSSDLMVGNMIFLMIFLRFLIRRR